MQNDLTPGSHSNVLKLTWKSQQLPVDLLRLLWRQEEKRGKKNLICRLGDKPPRLKFSQTKLNYFLTYMCTLNHVGVVTAQCCIKSPGIVLTVMKHDGTRQNLVHVKAKLKVFVKAVVVTLAT